MDERGRARIDRRRPDPPTTEDAPATGAPRSAKHTLEVILLGVILGGLLVVGGRWAWQEYGFVGREQRITVTWECANHIEWKDEGGIRWRVPDGAARPTPTSSSAYWGNRPMVSATETIRFDARDEATFRSDGGGETPMVRVHDGQLFPTSCAIP